LGKPEEVQGGRTFAVTVTFISPADNFNAVSITDLAADGWNVTVDKTWTEANSRSVAISLQLTADY